VDNSVGDDACTSAWARSSVHASLLLVAFVVIVRGERSDGWCCQLDNTPSPKPHALCFMGKRGPPAHHTCAPLVCACHGACTACAGGSCGPMTHECVRCPAHATAAASVSPAAAVRGTCYCVPCLFSLQTFHASPWLHCMFEHCSWFMLVCASGGCLTRLSRLGCNV
jgi:hypothetical protein